MPALPPKRRHRIPHLRVAAAFVIVGDAVEQSRVAGLYLRLADSANDPSSAKTASISSLTSGGISAHLPRAAGPESSIAASFQPCISKTG